MSEFKKAEVELAAISTAIADCCDSEKPVVLSEAIDLAARLKALGKIIEKYVLRKDEYDEITSEKFLSLLNSQRERVDAAAKSLAEKNDTESDSVGNTESDDKEASLTKLLQDTWQHESEMLAKLQSKRGDNTERRMRYGPRMRERIAVLRAAHIDLTSSGKMERILTLAEESAIKQRAAKQQREKDEIRQAQLTRDTRLREEEERNRASQTIAAANAAAKAVAELALRNAAIEAREKHAQEELAIAEERKEAERAAREWPKGLVGVERGLTTLRQSCSQEWCPRAADNTQTTGAFATKQPKLYCPEVANDNLKAAVAALCGVLGGIEKYPDDEKRRTLRINNTRFQQDIGKWDGGKECLFAAGFRLVHRIGETLNTETGLASIEPFLTLTEPDPFRAMEEWTAWMDNLKACTKSLKSYGEKIGATEIINFTEAPSWANRKC